MKLLQRLFRSALSFVALLAFVAPPSARAEGVCWPSIGADRTGSEARIRKSDPAAFIAPPRRQPVAYSPLPDSKRGVVRRVQIADGRKLVALTFDLCEQPYEISGFQGDIVDYLRSARVKATFFAGGKWLLTHRTRSEQLISDSLFEVGNHAWEHRNLRLLSGAGLYDEIQSAQLAYEDVHEGLAARRCVVPGSKGPWHGRSTKRMQLFRFPFGACDAKSVGAVNDQGLLAIQWDVSSGDPWIGQTSRAMTKAVLSSVRSGSIVLFHANGRGHNTIKALPGIVNELRAQGYEFVTVSQLLAAGRPEYANQHDLCFDHRPGDTNKYDALAQRLEVAYRAARVRAVGTGPLPQAPPSGGVPAVGSRALETPTANGPLSAPVPPSPQQAVAPPRPKAWGPDALFGHERSN